MVMEGRETHMTAPFDNQDDLRMTEQAARWVATLKNATDQEQAEFGAWLKESPRHVEEFLFVAAAEQSFDDLQRRGARVDAETLVANAFGNVVSLAVTASPNTPVAGSASDQDDGRTNKPWKWLAAASVLVAVTAGTWASQTYPRWYGYSTALGEQRTFELDDGSTLYLNTQSRVKVDIDSARRDIQMMKGEAMFRVARDPNRPFRVHAGDSTIQAVGTQFNVYRQSAQDTTVSVIEGLVRISLDENAPPDAGVRTGATAPSPGTVSSHAVEPGKDAGKDRALLLAAGESARIAPGRALERRKEVDIAKVSAWRQRRLVFRGDRLEDVAAEFNRYNQTPRIQIDGEQAANKQMAGVFDADDPESLLLFLDQYGDLEAERIGDRLVVIRGRDVQ